MAPPHIISWGASERSLSPVSTTTQSVVSIESITSDTSSTVPEPSGATQSRVKSKTFHVTLGNKASGVRLADDDPFTRHDKYYFMDGNITFLVDGILYCVHRYFFYRDSTYFSTRLEQLGIREHEAYPS
ncbi:hypothetical protein BC826DRAFT_1135241 [Russula brevipes]|nr:hypothetical protein BC826DRAFT_1135241 [Russula brevipes]